MIVGPSTQDATANYKLLIGSILPRAIAWVSTLSQDGAANLAPISFFTAVGRKPPMVARAPGCVCGIVRASGRFEGALKGCAVAPKCARAGASLLVRLACLLRESLSISGDAVGRRRDPVQPVARSGIQGQLTGLSGHHAHFSGKTVRPHLTFTYPPS